MLSVPTETSAFLGFVAICMTFLLVFYLYLTKKFCFNTIGGFPCCDQPLKISKEKAKKELVKAFSFDDELHTSTDSEDELIKRLQRSTSTQNNLKTKDSDNTCESSNKTLKNRHRLMHSVSLPQHHHHCDNKYNQTSNSSKLPIKCESIIESKSEHVANTSSAGCSGDLISLAEKGRIGKNGSTGGSGSSEAGSADNDEESHTSFSKQKKKIIINTNQIDSNNANNTNNKENRRSLLNNTTFEKCESNTQLTNSQEFSTHFQTDNPLITKCGSIEISYAYDAPTKKLIVNVIQANNIPCKERGGANQVHVRVILLPHKRQKHKTKIKASGNPEFNESFTFTRINPEDVMSLGLRFRVYGSTFARREHMIGEGIILFACMKPQQQETRLWLSLEPRSSLSSDSPSEVSSLARSDSTGSTQSIHLSLPELLVGLAYNGTTGRLNVSIIKGSQFRTVLMSRTPDTFCKLSLVSSSGQEIARSKTSVRRGQPNPLFKETFIFQVALFQLPDVTLMFSVYNKKSMKRKEMIGWFSLGYNSSGDEELSHWNDMRDSKGEQVCRWHVLLES